MSFPFPITQIQDKEIEIDIPSRESNEPTLNLKAFDDIQRIMGLNNDQIDKLIIGAEEYIVKEAIKASIYFAKDK